MTLEQYILWVEEYLNTIDDDEKDEYYITPRSAHAWGLSGFRRWLVETGKVTPEGAGHLESDAKC